MHPYVYCDIQQSAKAIPRLLLIVTALGLLLRFFGGPLGLVLTYLILVPNLVVGLGAGSLSEELHKGPIRFLYGLPVRRLDLWFVKAFFGILYACLVVVLISVILLAFRLETALQWLEIAKSFEIDLTAVLIFSAALLVYNFASGLFAATATSNNRTLSFINVIFVYLPFVAFWFGYSVLEIALDTDDLTLLFFASSIPLFIGSLWLFVRRNPFHEKPWWRRLQAFGFFVITLGVMAVTTLAAWYDSDSQTPRLEQVTGFAISPEKDRVAVASQERMIHTRGLLFDADGTLLQDFGRNFALPFTNLATQGDRLTWRPGRSQILSRSIDTSLFESGDLLATPFTLIDLESGIRRDLPYRKAKEEGEFIEYLGWTLDGETLVGTRNIDDHLFLFLQDAESGLITDLDGTFQWGPALHGDTVIGEAVIGEAAPEGSGGGPSLRMTDLRTGKSKVRILHSEVNSWTISPDARWLIWGERRIDERVEDVLLIEDLKTGEVRTVTGAPLPSAGLAEAARGSIGSLSVERLDHPDWSQISTLEADGRRGIVAVLSHPTGEIVALPIPKETTGNILPSLLDTATGSRLVFLGQAFTEESQAIRLLAFELRSTPDGAQLETLADLELPGFAGKVDWLTPSRLLISQTVLPDSPGEYLGIESQLRVVHLESGETHLFSSDEPSNSP